MKELKLYIGNVNCTSGNQTNFKIMPIYDDISRIQKIHELDVIILTEFYKYGDYEDFKKKFDENYDIAVNPITKKGYNEVFVAISKKIGFKIELDEIEFRQELEDQPDFTSVILTNNDGEKFAIIGTRIRSHKKMNYTGNASELSELLSFIEKQKNQGISHFIIGGDFNNARIIGDRNLSWENAKSGYNGKAQKPHNYHLIKDKFKDFDLYMNTPEGHSYPIDEPCFALDHLILSSQFNVVKIEYDENTKYSDHKALLATINIDE